MSQDIITGLDIGTNSIKVAVVENRGGRPALIGLFKSPAAGLRKGAIVEIAEASQAVSRALIEARKISKSAPRNIYLAVGSPQAKTQISRGIVAVARADNEIYQDDVDRVIRAAQAINLGSNRIVLHNITREFIIDGVNDIIDPLGLSGNRLEIESLIVDAFTPHIKNLTRAVEMADGEVSGLVWSPLAASRSALSRNQKEIGTAVIDLGFGTTGLSVYEENKLVGASVFPIGTGNVTNDLAIGLKIPVATAESLKLNFGYALGKEVGQKEIIDLAKFQEGARGMISRRFLGEIIEARLAEILDFINNELKLWERTKLPGGVVLSGGGAKLPGLTDLIRQELKLSSQIGLARQDEWAPESFAAFHDLTDDPEFINVLGLVLWGVERNHWSQKNLLSSNIVAAKARKIFRHFIP